MEKQEPHPPLRPLPLLILLRFRRTHRLQAPHPLRLPRRLRGPGPPPLRHPNQVPKPPRIRGSPPPGGRGVRVPDYRRTGPPCEPGFFREILRFLEEDEEKFGGVELDEFLNMVSEVGLQDQSSSCKESSASASSHHAFTPLLAKTRV
ncbi:UNVERIFIED_CONTAM: hypothetical protein Sradi_5774500 [Sesamum radiatum]|uniref:Uncharacterized protein n=1 Tax=Sesamum radiatum TaxID=300843 RepID=A0AAW2KP89_SESRA